MRNPVKWVKGWSRASKRYAVVSIVLTSYIGYEQDLYINLFSVILFLIFIAPINMFILAFIVDMTHSFIHWLEDDNGVA